MSHPQGLVDDVAVAGVPGATGRDDRIPRAWVVLSPAGQSLGIQEAVRLLDAWVREQLSRYKWLTGGISVVEEIPKNPTGKVLRRVLVDSYVKEMEMERQRHRGMVVKKVVLRAPKRTGPSQRQFLFASPLSPPSEPSSHSERVLRLSLGIP